VLNSEDVLVMSAPAVQPPKSGRFIRLYLVTWGLLAAGGLTYLASVAMQLDLRSPAQTEQAAKTTIDPEEGLRVANNALTEIDNVQHTVIEVQKDIGRLKAAADQRDAQDKETQSRLAALEEKVGSLASAPPAPATPPPVSIITVPSAKQKAADKAKAAAEKKSAEQRATARIVSVVETPKADQPAAEEPAEAPKLETGSIAGQPPPAITFGEPQVTPAKQQSYSIQLGAGPSLDALRMSWMALRDQHGDVLGSLQPRYVAPRGGTGSYRLVAGPLPSKSDAEKVCAVMGLGRDGCLPTTALGHPL
jgi:hypothetical protein